MSGNHDLERRVADFYATEVAPRAPDWVLESALETIDTTQQPRALIRLPRRLSTMNSYVKLATAALAVISVAVSAVALGPGLMSAPSRDPVIWTPERLEQDWPAPVRSEPFNGSAVIRMQLLDDARWDPDEGRWEPFEYSDVVGDLGLGDVAWLDIREVQLSPGPISSISLELAGDVPRPQANPAARWVAYGVVLDVNADGAADVRIGIDNMTGGDHRAWRTDLASGQTQWAAGPPYGYIGPDGAERVGLDTWYPGEEEQSPPNRALLRYSLQPDEEPIRFYAWASLIENGRVAATDYAPDAGWLEEGNEPGVGLVGPLWTVESIDSGDVVSSAPDEVSATLTLTDDGRTIVDAGCNSGVGSATVESRTLRVRDLSLTGRVCRADVAGVEAGVLAVLSADEVTYAIDAGILELRAGPDGLWLRGAFEAPPP